MTASGFCDFLAQCILVGINHCTYHLFYWPKSFSDLPLLDRVGPRYPCRDHSFNLGNHMLRSVILSSFDNKFSFQFIASSYLRLPSASWSNNNICTRPICDCWLEGRARYNKSHRIHGREYPGDELDRIQDQGVLGSRRLDQASENHIRNDRIWYGVVCHPTDSLRRNQPASGVGAY